jgi:head-tail adaptor
VSVPLPICNALVTIQARTFSTDAAGSPVSMWSARKVNVPCSIDEKTTTEIVQGGGDRQNRAGTAFFHSWDSIESTERLIWGSRTLDVHAVRELNNPAGFVEGYAVEWQEVSGAT